jgi:exodeoxyribonuclease-5
MNQPIQHDYEYYTKEYLTERFAFNINDQQVAAVNKAVHWYKGWQDRKHRRQIFSLAGYAGTGKTTIARIIAELCCGMDWTMFIAPTGKAASRLRQKGCPGAKTLHQFVYNVRGENEDGEPIFVAKGALDERPRLVCLDESSMVGTYDRDKILGHNTPLLALGDPGQIPPVKAVAWFSLATADVVLDQIERNAGNIVRASMFVRGGKRLPPKIYDDVTVKDGTIGDEELATFLGEDAVVLCSYNTTRHRYNQRARKILGYSGPFPCVGEKVVCTFNQHGYGIMNGEQAIILSYEAIPEDSIDKDEPDGMLLVNIKSLTDGKERMAKFNPASFSEYEDIRDDAAKQVGGFDFGSCLTIHKSQGSEWPRVLILEEILRGVPYHQLMYTGITRAIDYLAIRRYA